MAMTYQQAYQAAQDTNWLQRVEASIVAAAVAIAVDAPSAGVNTRRDALARKVLWNSAIWAKTFSEAVAVGFLAKNDLSAGQVSDTDIDNRVSAIWNKFMDQ